MVDLNAGWGSSATAVNRSGQVVGYRWLAGVGQQRAFSWTAAGGLVTFPEGCEITGLSENGTVIGRGYRSAANTPEQAFSWTRTGGFVALGNGYPKHVNERGQIVGQRVLSDGSSRTYLWSAEGGIVNLPASVSYPTDINDQGQVTGSFSAFQNHAFLWSRTGGLVDLGTLIPGTSGWSASNGLRVNENGHVVGDSIREGGFFHPFYWSPVAGMVRLDTLDIGHAGAVVINNNGIAFGYGQGSIGTAPHVFMWDMSRLQ